MGDATALVRPLLQRLGRADVECSVDVADDVRLQRVSSTLFEQGFLTLLVLALESLPGQAKLTIAAVHTSSGVRLTLRGASARASGALPRQEPTEPLALALTKLVAWLALKSGGRLSIAEPTPGGVSFELLLPVAAPEGPHVSWNTGNSNGN